MASPTPSKDVTTFLAPYALEVRSLALAARSFVFKMIPDISERVDAKARIIGYGYGRWVGTGLEANFLGPSPLAEPAERISRNGLPRLHARDSDQTVRWRVESA